MNIFISPFIHSLYYCSYEKNNIEILLSDGIIEYLVLGD